MIQSVQVQSMPSTFVEYVLQLPKWEQLLLQNLNWYIPEEEVMETLSTNILLFGTDGSANIILGLSPGFLVH